MNSYTEKLINYDEHFNVLSDISPLSLTLQVAEVENVYEEMI